jgi:hypothetical protein
MDTKATVTAGASSYSQALRVIGQAMETRYPEDFDVESYENGFLVRGNEKVVSQKTSLLQIFSTNTRTPQSRAFETTYTPEDVERLDGEGRSKRRDGGAIPDFYSLPQVLRTVGEYIDLRNAHLMGISRRGVRLILQYEKGDGQRTVEEHTIASFYNMFMRMYKHRSGRPRS